MTDVSPPSRRRPSTATAAPTATAVNPLLRQGTELAAAMSQVHKVHGDMVLRRADLLPKFKHIPTGIFSLDVACLGGFPEGAVTLGLGWEHSGKTTTGLRFLGRAQRKHPDQAAVLVDIEGTYSPAWGAIHGIDNERLALVQPSSGEQALDVAVAMVKAQEVSAIMVDSLAGLIPMNTKEKSFEDAVVGDQARMISRFCAVIQSELIAQRMRAHRVAFYLVNQYRYKIGVMRGDPRTSPGGVAPNYIASLKIDFKNKEQLGSDDDKRQVIDFNDHAFTIKKNKIGNGPREGEYQMVRNPDHPLGQGFIDDGRDVVTWAKAVGAVTGGGSSWRIRNCDDKFARLQDIADYLYDNPEFFEQTKIELIEDFREKQGMQRVFL